MKYQCLKIRTFSPPCNSIPSFQYSRVKEPDQIQKLNTAFLFRCTANGNCMYNSCLLLLNGEGDLCHLLRGLVTLELLVVVFQKGNNDVTNKSNLLRHYNEYLKCNRCCFTETSHLIIKSFRYSFMRHTKRRVENIKPVVILMKITFIKWWYISHFSIFVF